MNKKIIILSGGFDPIHKGHVRMFKSAKDFGEVFVGLNSDEWLVRKKGKLFMTVEERISIIKELKLFFQIYKFSKYFF